MNETDSSVIRAAEALIEKMTRPTRQLVRWVAAGCLLLVLVTGVLAYVVWQEHEDTLHIQHDAVQSCQAANTQRANEKKVWDAFIDLILKNDTSAKDQSEGTAFKEYVARVDAPRDCQKAYSISAPGFSALSPSPAKTKGSSNAGGTQKHASENHGSAEPASGHAATSAAISREQAASVPQAAPPAPAVTQPTASATKPSKPSKPSSPSSPGTPATPGGIAANLGVVNAQVGAEGTCVNALGVVVKLGEC